MRLFVIFVALLILTVYGGLVSAQGAYGAYPKNLYRNPQSAPGSSQSEGFYRWRPREEGDDDAVTYRDQRQPRQGTSVGDYTDEPFGLPRGTYRPIEDRHTITPQLEGFRFRPIVPEEQLRNRSRNEQHDQVLSDQGYRQPAGRADLEEVYPMNGQAPAFDFRPDPRLDQPARRAPSRYDFPMGSEAPRFRSH